MIRLNPSEVRSSVNGRRIAHRPERDALHQHRHDAAGEDRDRNERLPRPAGLAASSIAIPESVRISPWAKLIRPSTANTAAIPIASRA